MERQLLSLARPAQVRVRQLRATIAPLDLRLQLVSHVLLVLIASAACLPHKVARAVIMRRQMLQAVPNAPWAHTVMISNRPHLHALDNVRPQQVPTVRQVPLIPLVKCVLNRNGVRVVPHHLLHVQSPLQLLVVIVPVICHSLLVPHVPLVCFVLEELHNQWRAQRLLVNTA